MFYQSFLTGMPVIRPLWVQFPMDSNTFSLQTSFMFGGSILVAAVTKEGQKSTNVYLPTTATTSTTTTTTTKWYDLSNYNQCYIGGQSVEVTSPVERIPTFQRGGTIVARTLRLRRSTSQMHADPITLLIALGEVTTTTTTTTTTYVAKGELYEDDGETRAFQTSKSYLYMTYEYRGDNKKATIRGFPIVPTNFSTTASIERIIIFGGPGPVVKCSITCAGVSRYLPTGWNPGGGGGGGGGGGSCGGNGFLVMKKPDCAIGRNFRIDVKFR
eukprot:TRINITY_DN2044_c0_g1_i14.p1 TRINITY_DN2044_c0_g1~~TRINITY_DN2044_c0_g1_i14.p1  ORF type:complete len:271 (-),score=68.02 TRINITY_DN2044_c0_g1_i14:31-843(-)